MRRFLSGCLVGILFMLLLLAAAVGFVWHEQTVQVTQVRVELASLPETWDGARIGLIADFHMGPYMSTQRVASIVQRLNRQKPDVVVIAGDTVDSVVNDISEVSASIKALHEIRAPLGVFLVFGNHDSLRADKWRPLLRQAGIRVLENQHVRLNRSSGSVYLVGLVDAFHRRLNPRAAWQGVPANAQVIAAVHEPDVADQLAGRPLALQLSGHSHGGQVRIPFRRLVLPPLGRRYPYGLNRAEPGHLVYTTRGLGTSHIPLRLFARPEITIITLHALGVKQ